MNVAGKTFFIISAVCCLAGCTKTIEVYRYPEFYSTDLKSVTVPPFENNTLDDRAAACLTTQFVKALRTNGTYRVTAPDNLAPGPGRRRPAVIPSDGGAAAAALIEEAGGAQAVITGTVTTFTSAQYSYRWRHSGYGYPRRLRRPYYWRNPTHFYAHNEGRVRASATISVISDGSISAKTTACAAESVISEGDPPHLTPDECLIEAGKRAADKLVGQLAVVRIPVRVPLEQALRTARETGGDKLQFTDSFSADAGEIIAVVSLPPECGENEFYIEATRPGLDDVLLHRKFIWAKRDRELKLAVKPEQLDPSPGGKTFVITLYSQGEPIRSRRITVK